MRRNVLVLAVVALVAFAGSAFAYGHGGWGGGCRGGEPRALCGGEGDPQGVHSGFGARMRTEVPQAVRHLMDEAHRTQLQLRLALTEDKVDAAKAKALFEKAQELRGKIARWRFEESLKRKAPAN